MMSDTKTINMCKVKFFKIVEKEGEILKRTDVIGGIFLLPGTILLGFGHVAIALYNLQTIDNFNFMIDRILIL